MLDFFVSELEICKNKKYCKGPPFGLRSSFREGRSFLFSVFKLKKKRKTM